MIWQMMVALLHSNGQLMTGRYGDTVKGCQKPAAALLMMMTTTMYTHLLQFYITYTQLIFTAYTATYRTIITALQLLHGAR